MAALLLVRWLHGGMLMVFVTGLLFLGYHPKAGQVVGRLDQKGWFDIPMDKYLHFFAFFSSYFLFYHALRPFLERWGVYVKRTIRPWRGPSMLLPIHEGFFGLYPLQGPSTHTFNASIRTATGLLVLFLLLGFLSECLQGLLPYRIFDGYDILANVLGSVLAFALLTGYLLTVHILLPSHSKAPVLLLPPPGVSLV